MNQKWADGPVAKLPLSEVEGYSRKGQEPPGSKGTGPPLELPQKSMSLGHLERTATSNRAAHAPWRWALGSGGSPSAPRFPQRVKKMTNKPSCSRVPQCEQRAPGKLGKGTTHTWAAHEDGTPAFCGGDNLSLKVWVHRGSCAISVLGCGIPHLNIHCVSFRATTHILLGCLLLGF